MTNWLECEFCTNDRHVKRIHFCEGKVEIKQSLYRPGQALRVPAGWGPQISRQSVQEDGKVVSPTHRSPLPPRKYSWFSFLLRVCVVSKAIARPEGCSLLKMSTATFRSAAQCRRQLRHRKPWNSPIGIPQVWMEGHKDTIKAILTDKVWEDVY